MVYRLLWPFQHPALLTACFWCRQHNPWVVAMFGAHHHERFKVILSITITIKHWPLGFFAASDQQWWLRWTHISVEWTGRVACLAPRLGGVWRVRWQRWRGRCSDSMSWVKGLFLWSRLQQTVGTMNTWVVFGNFMYPFLDIFGEICFLPTPVEPTVVVMMWWCDAAGRTVLF